MKTIEEIVDKVMEVLEKHTKLRQRDMETFKRWLTTSYSEVDRRAREEVLKEVLALEEEWEMGKGWYVSGIKKEDVQTLLTNLTPKQ